MEEHAAASVTAQNSVPLEFARLAGRLKHIPRTGWLRFMTHPESVAAHSFRLALIGLTAPQPLDFQKCMFLGIIHDLAESVVGDIPTYVKMPKPEKHRREALGIEYICGLLEPYNKNIAELIRSGWNEYEVGETPEARYMKEMDKVECLEQAVAYEGATYGLEEGLSEFQELASKVCSDVGKDWTRAIRERRGKDILRRKQRYRVIFVTGNFGDDDTQIADLAVALGMRHISLAAVLRNASVYETHPHAKLVAPFLVGDDEPPVFSVVDLLDESIRKDNSTGSWCLVSGYPRSKDQHREYEITQKDNYVLSVGPAPEERMYDGWKPQQEDFAEGHFAEVCMSGPSLVQVSEACKAMRRAVSAFLKHETEAEAGCH